jgi:hypothetical protein
MITAMVVFSLSSCKKDESASDPQGTNIADDDAVSEAVFEDVFNSVDIASITLDDGMKDGVAKSEFLSGDSCPAITVNHPESGIWPKVVTIDYGTGCTGFFDNTRSGKIIIEVTGPRIETGSKRTVTFDNYYINGIKVEGTKVLENLGPNASQNYVVSVKLTDGKLTLPDGKTIERSFEHQREWIAGFLTKNLWDDECLITGTATGKNMDGISYTRTILTALHWERVCRFIVSGVVKIDREGMDPVTFDYGTGDCDNKAVVTSGSVSKEITLRYKFRHML